MYNEKKAFDYPEMKSYCDKLLLHARAKKNTDPKLKNEPDMKMYRILSKHVESFRASTTRTSEMQMTAEVEKDAQALVVGSFTEKQYDGKW